MKLGYFSGKLLFSADMINFFPENSFQRICACTSFMIQDKIRMDLIYAIIEVFEFPEKIQIMYLIYVMSIKFVQMTLILASNDTYKLK